MKVLEFTLPVVAHNSIITKEEKQTHFYPHLHRHNEIQLKWIIKGEGTLVAGNSLHHFKSNEIYWIGARQAHVFKSNQSAGKNKSKNKFHSIDIFFNMETQLAPFFALPEMERLKTFVDKHQSGFKVPSENVPAISAIMQQLNNSMKLDRVLNFILLFKLLLSLKHLEPLTTSTEFVQVDERDGMRIAGVYNHILKNFRKQISLEEVAKLAFMTPQAFCRYFKKHTHHTLIGFINQVRINEACKQLMENKNDTIAAIAYSTGFNSITNFNRIFKTVVKKSPKEYVASLKQVE